MGARVLLRAAVCAVCVVAWAALPSGPVHASPPSEIPLFQHREILRVELVADFANLDGSSKNAKTAGTLRILDGEHTYEFDMYANWRGHYKKLTCDFSSLFLTLLPTLDSLQQALEGTTLATSDPRALAALRREGATVDPTANPVLAQAFAKAIAATFTGTPLANSQNRLVFDTHCALAKDQARQAFLDERVNAEHALYEAVDASEVLPTLKIRLLDATYRKRDGSVITAGRAFIVEHKDDLARRMGYEQGVILEGEDPATEKLAEAKYDVEPLKGILPFYFANQMIVNNDFKYFGHNGIILSHGEGGDVMVPYDFDLSALVGGLHSGPFWEPKRTDDRLWFQLLAKKDPHYWSSRGVPGAIGDKVSWQGRKERAVAAEQWEAATYDTARELVARRAKVLAAAAASYLDAKDKKRLEQRLNQFFDALEAELASKR